MPNITKSVREIIEKKPFIQEALSRGIINNAALAEQIIPDIEKELKKKVKFSAVNMAIRRLAEQLENKTEERPIFNDKTDIIIQSDLIGITIYKNQNIQKHIQKLYGIIDFGEGDFLTITQGLNEVMLITNKRFEKRVLKLFSGRIIKKIIRQLCSLTLRISEDSVETVGTFYLATRAMNWENINIVDIVSTYTEMTLIVKEDDVSRSFTTLKKLIENNKA